MNISQEKLDNKTKQTAVFSDAINISDYLEKESVSLCVTSPPYANMLNRPRLNKSLRGDKRKNGQYLKVQQYSNNPRDLGTMEAEKFSREILSEANHK